jgi:hypothetical protein
MAASPEFIIEKLGKQHSLSGFDCRNVENDTNHRGDLDLCALRAAISRSI